MPTLRDRSRRVTFRRLLAATTGLTFTLVVIGVWTAIGGYGLTCEARWPFCDGAVFGLFPAHWGSFVEWFHRLVAMITGFAILGSALAAWRATASTRIRLAATLALVLTPIQVWLGALTVTRYELLVLASHFGTALVILALLIAATVWAYEGRGTLPAPPRLSAFAAVVLPAVLLLSPGLLIAHSTALHVAYYAVGLAAFVALFSATLRARELGATLISLALLTGATVAVATALIVGRVDVALIVGPAAAEVLSLGTIVTGLALSAFAAWLTRNEPSAPAATASPGR